MFREGDVFGFATSLGLRELQRAQRTEAQPHYTRADLSRSYASLIRAVRRVAYSLRESLNKHRFQCRG